MEGLNNDNNNNAVHVYFGVRSPTGCYDCPCVSIRDLFSLFKERAVFMRCEEKNTMNGNNTHWYVQREKLVSEQKEILATSLRGRLPGRWWKLFFFLR